MDERQKAGAQWNSFWADFGKNIANLAKPIQGADKSYSAYGNWDSKKDPIPEMTMRGESNSPLTQGQRVGMGSGMPAPSNSMQLLNNIGGAPKMPGLDRGVGNADGSTLVQESAPGPSEDELRMAELDKLLGRDFEASGENDAMIDQAYASALANIGKARGQANSNFAESDARVADLTQGHVNQIQTADKAAVEKIGGDLQSSYGKTFSDARNTIAADRTAENSETADMLSRLGIADAGMGDSGKAQTEAITRLTQNEAGAKSQGNTYQAADLTRNVEQAQSQASAGVERRSALNSQLQKILGNIDGSEAEVQQNISMAKLTGKQQEKNDFRQEQQFNLDTKRQMEESAMAQEDKTWERAFKEKELAAKNQGGSSGVIPAVGENLKSRGIDPAPYLQAYSDVASKPYNAQIDGDMVSHYVRKMREKNPGLDQREILQYVLGVQKSGTNDFAK